MQKHRLRDNVLRLEPVYIQSKCTDAVVNFSILDQRHRKATRISHTREYRRHCSAVNIQREDHMGVSCPVSSVGRASDF